MSVRRKFFFLITYFKPSGKYYTSTVVEWEIAAISHDQTVAYLTDAVHKLRGLRNNGGQGGLPGLISDGWDGPILIQQAKRHTLSPHLAVDDFTPDGVPHLLVT